jgi:hypothetical protein
MKNNQYHTVGLVQKYNTIIVVRGKIDTPNAQIHDRSLSLLDTGTSMNSLGVKLAL